MNDESDYDVEDDIQHTLIMKKSGMKKLSSRVSDAPMGNVSFHFRDNVSNGSMCMKEGFLLKGNWEKMRLNVLR